MARKVVETDISYDDEKKRFYVNMDYGKDVDGKRIKKTKTFKTKEEARKALREFKVGKDKGTIVIPKEMTLKLWLEYWLENVALINLAKTTVYGYRQIIENHIVPTLGGLQLQKVRPHHIQSYIKEKLSDVNNKLSPNSIRKHIDLLKTVFKFAIKQELIIRNPIDGIEAPKIRVREKSVYSIDEMTRLFELVKGDRLEVVVKLAGYLGLRREEISGLRWENINFENRIIQIVNALTMAGGELILKETKTETSSRKLYLDDDLYCLLNALEKVQAANKVSLKESYQDTGFVVQWEDGRPIRPNYLSELFTKFIKDNGLPKIVLHDLRHTFASIANAMGIPLYDIGKALGHSTIDTTARIYVHMMDKASEKTVRAVSDAISNKGRF